MSLLTKIAHNNRLSLATRDIKQLQEIISSERRLVEQTQRLSSERDRASATLREWGNAEGPDLEDVLGKVSVLFEYLSKAELAFAEHNGNYRLRFKEIRSKEENLSALKKSRDSLAGRIEAQERKVSKMKEENKDLPAQRQRLREMQQEMIGLENSVLTEETRLSDFKRAATREALSLKLGALLELAEKTVIIAELGKLIVDMLPMDETEPGQPRAYYDGHQRTEELLGEAQRCLQDVVFNPAPVTEGLTRTPQHHQSAQYGAQDQQQQQHYGEGAAHPTNQFDEAGIRAVHPTSDFGPSHQRTASGHYQDASYASYQTHQSYASPEQPQPQHHAERRLSGQGGADPLSGPQLQPLPDFRPLSVLTPPAGPESAHQQQQQSYYSRAPAHEQPQQLKSPAVEGYSSHTPMLAPPTQDERYNPDRSSLAYMGEAPLSPTHAPAHPHCDEDEAARAVQRQLEAEEHALEVAEREAHEQREYDQEQQRYQGEQYEPYDYAQGGREDLDEGRQLSPHAGEGEDVTRRDMHDGVHAPIHASSAPLSPITEVPTPAADQLAAGSAQHFTHEPAGHASQPGSSQGHGQIDDVRPPSAADSRPRYEGHEHEQEPYSPNAPASSATPIYASHASPPPVHINTPPPASPAPMSPVGHSPPPALAPPAPGAFEPRPLTPKSAASGDRRPIQIRPQQGEAALGSKYGDVFVPARAGVDGGPYSPAAASPRTGANPADAGLSGYFGASAQSPGGAAAGGAGEQKRTIQASAFRRPQPPALATGSYGVAGAGGARFAASGYQYDAASAGAHSPGPSESERIAAQWRETATPEQREQARLEGYDVGPEPPAPSFDTRPLQVNKNRQGSLPGGVGRSGTLPSHLDGPHGRSASLGGAEQAAYGEPPAPAYGEPVSRPAPPVGYAPPLTAPLSPSSQGGFASDRFVTRLD
ncbi:hypothetical protein JCM10449v2_002628 [Rhodotorula kratochvilovae]